MEQLNLHEILLAEFNNRKARNPSYSRRAFARKIGVSSGALAEYLNGRRRISEKIWQRISAALHLEEKWMESTKDSLSLESFELISNPLHFVFLNLFKLDAPPQTLADFSEKTKLSKDQCELMLDKLVGLSLVKKRKDGVYKRTSKEIEAPDGVSSRAIQYAHSIGLLFSENAIESIDMEERDFTMMYFSGDSSSLEKAREKIRRCQDSISTNMQKGKKSEVYQLSVHLFPVTQLNVSQFVPV